MIAAIEKKLSKSRKITFIIERKLSEWRKKIWNPEKYFRVKKKFMKSRKKIKIEKNILESRKIF